MRLKCKEAHRGKSRLISLFDVDSVILVLDDRMSEISHEIEIYKALLTYEAVYMQIQFFKGGCGGRRSL